MGVLDVLSGAAKVGGQAFQGYGIDQQLRVKDALAQSSAKRQAERDAVLNALTQRQIARPQLGDETYAPAMAEVKGAETAAAIPAEVAKATALAPIAQATHTANRQTDVANPLPVAPTFTPVTLRGGEGEPDVVKPMNTRTGAVGAPIGDAKSVASVGGAAEKSKRIQALANVSDALNSFEKNLTTTGSTIMPGVAKSDLQTNYVNLQLQLKEMYNLGVLNGPDLMLMQKMVDDPTDLKGRALAGGNSGEQTARALAQVKTMREKVAEFQNNLAAGNQAGAPASAAPGGAKTLSSGDAAKARSDPGFAAWLKSQGYAVP